MTELDKALQEIKVDNIKSIDSEITNLERQVSVLRSRRNELMIRDIDFVGKYFKVTNFGGNYVTYVHVKEVRPNKQGVHVIGDTFITLLNKGYGDCQVSVEFIKNGMTCYDIDPDIHSNVFEEISGEEFRDEIEEVLYNLHREIRIEE